MAAIGVEGYYRVSWWGWIFTGSLMAEAVGTLALGHDIRFVWLRSFRVLLVIHTDEGDEATMRAMRRLLQWWWW